MFGLQHTIFFALLITQFGDGSRFINKPFFLFTKNCLSTDCQNLGLTILTSLNYTAKPCNDFYTFTCGNYNKKTVRPLSEPYWNIWQETARNVNRKVEELLEENKEDHSNSNEAITKAVTFYEKCVNMDTNSNKQLLEVQLLLEKLGGWKNNSFSSEIESNWSDLFAQVVNNVGLKTIFAIHVDVDYENTKKYLLYLEPGEFALPISLYLDEENRRNSMNYYKEWMSGTLKEIFGRNIIEQDILDVIDLEIQLVKLSQARNNKIRKLAISELKNECFFDFPTIFQRVFHGINASVNSSTVIAVKNYEYFKKTSLLLQNTKNHKIWNYIIWSLVKDLSRHITPELRALNFNINKAIFDTQQDLDIKQECIQNLLQNLKYAHLPKYLEKYETKRIFAAVNEITFKIKKEFVEMLNGSDWLQSETKLKVIDKVNAIKFFVGYPKWASNNSLVEKYYKHLNFKHNHFLNMLKVKKFNTKMNLQLLDKNVHNFDWPINPLEVNAFYSVLKNSIIIPFGILNDPFFNINRPKLFNYGYLGSIIGHEISHALDLRGIKVNKFGEMSHWFPSTDWKKYNQKVACFENQYNNLSINGVLTLEENIADNIGIILSYNALFRNFTPVAIPFLESFTYKQLFFISYAQLWCEVYSSNNEDVVNDEHADNKARVLGTINNFKEFDNAFNCTKLNGNGKCNLW